jgi:hypothetical protein
MIFLFIKLDSYIQNVAAHEILRFPSDTDESCDDLVGEEVGLIVSFSFKVDKCVYIIKLQYICTILVY